MNSAEHLVIKSGKFYYTWSHGYSFNIDKAMWVKKDAKLTGKQRFVRVRCNTIIEEVE